MITWITENIAIGEYTDAINEELLKKEKIDCVLNLRAKDEASVVEKTLELFLGIKYFHVGVGSHQGLEPIKIELRTATYMLELLTEKYKRILVHCTAGIDRAPFVVAYWMVGNYWLFDDISYLQGEDLKFWIRKSYKFIKEKRPQIVEHYEWI